MNFDNEMRAIMILVESYHSTDSTIVEEVVEETPKADCSEIVSQMRDIVFKLRSHTENDTGDLALGIEQGMQTAADMVENLINRLEGI